MTAKISTGRMHHHPKALLLLALVGTVWIILPEGAGRAWADVPTCTTGDNHARLQAWSGFGGNWGTAVSSYGWTQYTVANFHTDFTDEAAWSIDNNNPSRALESGISAGLGASPGIWSPNIYAYYTLNGGAHQFDFLNDTFRAGEPITMYAYMNSAHLWNAVVGPYSLVHNLSYTIPEPRLNAVQGENSDATSTFVIAGKSYHNSVAGGGASFAAYYLPANTSPGGFNPWGNIHGTCTNAPPVYPQPIPTGSYTWYMGAGYPSN